MSELVYRQPCYHVRSDQIGMWCKTCDAWGVIEIVLPPDKVLNLPNVIGPKPWYTVADVLAALEGEQ